MVVTSLGHSTQLVGSHSKVLKSLDAPVLQALKQAIERVDAKLAAAIKMDPSSQQAFEHITSVPGLGLVCASLLVMLFGRMQERSSDAVVAFTGLDPRPNDSGKKMGQRRLSKRGWPEIRRLLFAAAMSAARTKTWSGLYEAQRKKGLSTTAAACGVRAVQAEKLLRWFTDGGKRLTKTIEPQDERILDARCLFFTHCETWARLPRSG